LSGVSNILLNPQITDVTALVKDLAFTAIVGLAVYGWISITRASKLLHKADHAHFLLAVGGVTLLFAYFLCSFMLKKHLESYKS